MWHKEYRDYRLDSPLKKERVEPGKGIIGCEMAELNGWGNTLHNAFEKSYKKSVQRGQVENEQSPST